MTHLARKARFLSRILAWILGGAFGFLKLSNVPLIELANDQSANFLLRAVMVGYYLMWILGTSWDSKDLELVYVTAPKQGRLPVAAVLFSLSIAIFFGVLCWVSTPEDFAVTLVGYSLATFAAWYYMSRFLLADARRISIAHYQETQDIMGLVKFKLVDESVTGDWQIKRFLVGFVALLIINIHVRSSFPETLASLLGIKSVEFCQIAVLTLFIIAMELQMLMERVKRKAGLAVLSDLERSEKYQLQIAPGQTLTS